MQRLKEELKQAADPKRATVLQRFFKTGKGEYAEGDIFLGIKAADHRRLSRKYTGLSLAEVQKSLRSKIHDERSVAIFIMVLKFQKASDQEKKEMFDLYLKNTDHINNWDLVDLSAPTIVGGYLADKPRGILYKLAKSENLWERRISVLATYAFIRDNEFKDIFKIAEILLNDEHDLIHKAVGWMLREVGKRDLKTEEKFLKKYRKKMPRTMLRYAIEKFPEAKRQYYLKK